MEFIYCGVNSHVRYSVYVIYTATPKAPILVFLFFVLPVYPEKEKGKEKNKPNLYTI